MTPRQNADMPTGMDAGIYADIRAGIAKICAEFPDSYWRALDSDRAYPEAFVTALTKAGYLGCLIPESYGGSGLDLTLAAVILKKSQKWCQCRGCMRKCTRWVRCCGMAVMNKNRLSAADCRWFFATSGLWCHRAHVGHRYAGASNHGAA